jgi:hypothetical protein
LNRGGMRKDSGGTAASSASKRSQRMCITTVG